jgi:ubiquinone/menaquinone biosynthesis C-methylase UbiE
MSTPQLSETQEANVRYHSLLAPVYRRQPFLGADNRLRVRRILQDLQRRTSGRRLLDIGCGAGFIFDAGHDLFEKLDGVDITGEMLALIESRPNVTACNAPAEALPFADGVFDVVTCNGVLHHIEHIGQALAEARRVLRPGGIFYADEIPCIPFRESLSALNDNSPMTDLLKSELWKVAGDVERYEQLGIEREATRNAMVQCYQKGELRPEKLEELLSGAGFETIDIQYRWFLGQAQIRDSRGEDAARQVEEYLTSALPLTRHLFKNLMIVAS